MSGTGKSFQNAYILPKNGGIIPIPYPSNLGGNTAFYESRFTEINTPPCLLSNGCIKPFENDNQKNPKPQRGFFKGICIGKYL